MHKPFRQDPPSPRHKSVSSLADKGSGGGVQHTCTNTVKFSMGLLSATSGITPDLKPARISWKS